MSKQSRPIATLSLDLDNLWTYLATHGDDAWQRFPSYHNVLVPRVLQMLKQRKLAMTVFVVGKDATLPECRGPLNDIVQAGHEIGNHSFLHEQWVALEGEPAIDQDLAQAQEAIERCMGTRPRGYRGPGFSLSTATLDALHRRGFLYDASSFPTYMGPMARAYFMATSKLTGEARRKRARLFGRLSDAARPLHPHRWRLDAGQIVEVPVTTLPGLKLPMHMTYLLFLAQRSEALALAYFRTGLALCRASGIAPSLLLHPPEFLGLDTAPSMAFFPNMRMPLDKKLRLVDRMLAEFAEQFDVMPLGSAVERLNGSGLRVVSAQRFVPAADASTNKAMTDMA